MPPLGVSGMAAWSMMWLPACEPVSRSGVHALQKFKHQTKLFMHAFAREAQTLITLRPELLHTICMLRSARCWHCKVCAHPIACTADMIAILFDRLAANWAADTPLGVGELSGGLQAACGRSVQQFKYA